MAPCAPCSLATRRAECPAPGWCIPAHPADQRRRACLLRQAAHRPGAGGLAGAGQRDLRRTRRGGCRVCKGGVAAHEYSGRELPTDAMHLPHHARWVFCCHTPVDSPRPPARPLPLCCCSTSSRGCPPARATSPRWWPTSEQVLAGKVPAVSSVHRAAFMRDSDWNSPDSQRPSSSVRS